MRILAPLSLVLVTACIFAITFSTLGRDEAESGSSEAAPLVAEDLPPLRPIASAPHITTR